MVHIALGLQQRTGQRRLTLAGGVALNSVANGKILDRTPFAELFVQPAAGDNGTSIGAALWVEHQLLMQPRRFVMHHAYTGPTFSSEDCEAAVRLLLGEVVFDGQGRAEVPDVETVGRDGQPAKGRLRQVGRSQRREAA